MTACSKLSLLLDEPLAGTAPVAGSWIVFEQRGPWGRMALTQSHLDPVLGAALETAAAAHGARVALVRRPGRHPDSGPASRRVWVASTRPGASWLLGGWVEDVAELGSLAWRGLERGDRELVRSSLPVLRRESEPLLLVCTNGRRDVCCANFGRPLVGALRDRFPGRVWETTHLGGHRFAPTAALLPQGVVYGRLDIDGATRLVDEAHRGRQLVTGYRGRSTFSRPGQAAEAAVRREAGIDGIDDLDIEAVEPVEPAETAAAVDSAEASSAIEPVEIASAVEPTWSVVVVHQDGRRWIVRVAERSLEPPRPESCGAAVIRPLSYIAGRPVVRK